jgi:hypothetical protein
MDADLEPVVTLELSLFEAWAVHMFLVQNEAEVRQAILQEAAASRDVQRFKQPLLTTQRALAKVKAGIDLTFLECKRRWPRVPTDDLREDDE